MLDRIKKFGFPGLSFLLVLAAFFSLVRQQMAAFADDPGVGWHLKTGEWILANGKVPIIDPFLSSESPRTWISDQWASDVLLAWLNSLGGWPLIYAFFTALFVITFFVILNPVLCRLTGSKLVSVLVSFIAFKFSLIHFILRPVGFSILFFAILFGFTYSAVKRFAGNQEGGVTGIRIWEFISLPLLFMIWANMHPAFVLGLVFLGAFICGMILDMIFLQRDYEVRGLAAFIVLAVLCFLATFANPYFCHLHDSIIRLGESTFFMSLNKEWAQPNFRGFEGQMFEVVTLAVLLCCLISPTIKKRLGFCEVLPLLVFTHFSLQMIRALPFFGICASLLFAYGIVELRSSKIFLKFPLFQRIFARLENTEKIEQKAWSSGIPAFVIAVLVIGITLARGSVPFYGGEYGPGKNKYPYQVLQFLKSEIEAGETAVVLATPDWGGFITHYGWPGIKAVIDDRNTLLGEKVYKDYLEGMKITSDTVGYMKSVGATHLLVRDNTTFSTALKKRGSPSLVVENGFAALFERESDLRAGSQINNNL